MYADIREKAQAALNYSKYATGYAAEQEDMQCKYVQIPHDQVSKTSSLRGVVSPNIYK